METELKRKLAAILVADVVGYSRLIADDEEATLRRLEVFRGIWQDCVSRCRGRIFNTAGDAILVEFQSVVDAVRCAVEFQAEARAQNETLVGHRQMQFRIGITIGDVVERGSDLLGDGVNVAARLQTLAGAGGICVSSWVREQVGNRLPVVFTDIGEQTVKNIPTPVRAYRIDPPRDGLADVSPAEKAALPDWVGRATSSWKAMGAVAALAVAGIAAVFMATAQLRNGSPQATPTAKTVSLDDLVPKQSKTAAAQPKADPAPPAKTVKEPTPVVEQPKLPPQAPVPIPPVKAPSTTQAPPVVVPQGPSVLDPAVRRGPLSEAAERELKPRDRFKECDTCPEMVVVPAGEFQMGATGYEADEQPVRKVTIGARFAVSRYAVTVDEFETFLAVTGYKIGTGCRAFEAGGWRERSDLSFKSPGFPQAGHHPVVCVNWNDAKAYTDWMSARMTATYRLPTEAEREYVTRAGTTTLFWWGNSIDPGRAAYDWTTGIAASPKADRRRGTHPVNAFEPNPWGLYQVHGNVSEWVEDCWGSYRNAPTNGAALLTGDCSVRGLRGGSWGNSALDLRSSYRGNQSVHHRNFNVGFRVVRALR